MTDEVKTRKRRIPWVQWLIIAVVSSFISGAGVTYIMHAKLAQIEQRTQASTLGIRLLFEEFCITRARQLSDPEAKKVCKSIWDSALKVSAETGIFVSPFILARIIDVESRFNETALSHANAYGLAQIHLPAYGNGEKHFGCNVIFDVDCNIYAGALVYAECRKHFDERTALYCYNRGRWAVQRALMRGENPSNGYAAKVMA